MANKLILNESAENKENIKYYDGWLELSDKPVVWSLNADIDDEEYWYLVDINLDDFASKNNIPTEDIGYAGRMGRHVVLKDTTENRKRYFRLKDKFAKAQEDFINMINREYAPKVEEETAKTEELRLKEGTDSETLEGQGWEYVASKDVYDEDGFRDVYYWYKKDGNNRFFFSSDVDYGDPDYFDWETEGTEAAQDWFDSYGEEESIDAIYHDASEDELRKMGAFDNLNEEHFGYFPENHYIVKVLVDGDWIDWGTLPRTSKGRNAVDYRRDFLKEYEDVKFFIVNKDGTLTGKTVLFNDEGTEIIDEAFDEEELEDFSNPDDIDRIVDLIKVTGPQYRGDRYPEFNSHAINVRYLPDNMRPKYYEFNGIDDEVEFKWTTQEPFSPEDAEKFKKEIDRFFKQIIEDSRFEEPFSVDVEVVCRDGEEHGHDKFELKYNTETLDEGISDSMSVEDIAKKHKVPVEDIEAQVKKGIKVEKEHTDDEEKAKRIALDHLFEIPDYYDRLGKMEKGALKEEPDNKARIKIEVIVDNALDEEVVSGRVEDKYDEQTLEDWYNFASNVESIVDKKFIVTNISLSKSPESLSEYIDFYRTDENGNKKEGLVDLRLSDHASTSNARQLRKIKVSKIDSDYSLISVIVNAKRFDSYKEALKYIENLLDSLNESLKEARSSKKADEIIKDWYEKQFPDDYQIDKLDPWITFADAREIFDNFGFSEEFDKTLGINLDTAVVDHIYDEMIKRTSLKEDLQQPTPMSSTSTTIANKLIDAINGEWDTIILYNDIITELREEGFDDIIPVIQDIVKEENTHVGQLQKALETISPDTADIQSGEVEALGQLNDNINESLDKCECEVCCDDLTAEESDRVNEEEIRKALSDGTISKDTIVDYTLTNTPDAMLKDMADLIEEDDKSATATEIKVSDDDLSDEDVSRLNIAEDQVLTERKKLQEMDPITMTLLGAAASAAASKLIDKAMDEECENCTHNEDDLDESVLASI